MTGWMYALPSFPHNYFIHKQLNRIGNTILHFATHKLYHTMKNVRLSFSLHFFFFLAVFTQQMSLHHIFYDIYTHVFNAAFQNSILWMDENSSAYNFNMA